MLSPLRLMQGDCHSGNLPGKAAFDILTRAFINTLIVKFYCGCYTASICKLIAAMRGTCGPTKEVMTHALLTCSEHFSALALNELQRQHPRLTVVEQLSAGHIRVENPGTFGTLTRPWRNKLPIYLHHLFPIHASLDLHGNPADLHLIRCHAQTLIRDPVTVQARVLGDVPYTAMDIHSALARADPGRFTLAHPPGRVLSIFVANAGDAPRCYLGVSWAAQNLSPWNGGTPPDCESVPNRAGLKLIEAFDTFRVRLDKCQHALDLGAAPGAWTTVLRRHGLRVTAVAPTPMYPWLADNPAVRVYTTTAEEYLPRCDTMYDLLLNDMKLDAQDSARLMQAYARHLRPGGVAIMTLKLQMRNQQRRMDHSYRILRKAYKIIYVRQLVSNRKEVTLFLRRKEAAM